MKIIKENLHGYLNEDMQQARAILKKLQIPEQHPEFQQIKQMLLKDNKIGYVGKFTQWRFKDREPLEKILDVYEMLKDHPTKVPPIHTFKTVEDLFDFLQGSGINTKVNQVINQIPSRARQNVTDKLKKLIELNIKHVEALKDFYAKKGGKFKDPNSLYKETESLIKNLGGDFNKETFLKRVKGHNVDIILERPDLLVLRPLDYRASQELGSQSWCISYNKSYWDSYVDVFSNQYFIYDFTKNLSEKESMIGATINPDGTIKAAHFKDDSVCRNAYLEELFADN